MDDKWRIGVRIQATVYWREPPKDREEETLRKLAETLANAKAAEFEKELSAILTSDIKAMNP